MAGISPRQKVKLFSKLVWDPSPFSVYCIVLRLVISFKAGYEIFFQMARRPEAGERAEGVVV